MKAIETSKLTKFYGKSRGIVDVDLSVEQGDFFGFIGPNGAGKSTLIRTLMGLINKSGGGATVLGMDIEKDKTKILSCVGYLPSDVPLYKGMKVKEVLAFSASLRRLDCTKKSKELCERLDLDIDKKVEQLSFGNRKKVGIVCALQHEPCLYILDEPTSGLDPLIQKEFYEILKSRNEEGATVFLSSHILSEVERYCKKAAVIREGRILVSDAVSRLGHTGVKRVILRGARNFTPFENIKDLRYEKEGLQFLYSGDRHKLLSFLESIEFEDFTVTDPELDEVFMHYYQKEEKT